LVFREEAVKVTIALSKRSVEFFKTEARRHNIQYQKMIRRLLDRYAEQYVSPGAVAPPRPKRRRSAG
jgi:predicted DNA binding CopG/RHH family protein